MEPNEIRDIVDWDARSRSAARALTSTLKSEPLDVPTALELVEIIARLALDFAGDSQRPKANRLRTRCEKTLHTLESHADQEQAERIALTRLQVTRVTRSVYELGALVALVRQKGLDDWSEPAIAVLQGADAHCKWEGRDRDAAREQMVEAAEKLAEHATAEPARWLSDYAWMCGRLAYWFDMANQGDQELHWRKRTVAALTQQLEHTQSVRGLLGLNEEKLGRQLMQQGALDAAVRHLEAAADHVSHWEDASKHVRSALRKLRKKRAKATRTE